MKREVILIGGGLAGLTAAYSLVKQDVKPLILEANNRLGGRIYTKLNNGLQFELGATWVFQDMELKKLLSELGLPIYPQYLNGDALIKYHPSMDLQRKATDALMQGASYHKITAGTGAVIDALASHIDPDDILLNTKVISLINQDNEIELTTADGTTYQADKVIITVPPKVIAEQINISPQLANQNFMQSTHTWMGESSKFTVVFDQDYWRGKNLSGFVYSNYGLISEMQDHSTSDGKSFGLLGFLQPTGEFIADFEQRKKAVLTELNELFGIEAKHVLAYDDFLWSEYYSDVEGKNYNNGLFAHQNNGHASYLQPHFDCKLIFAGAETSPTNPGYMEGAVKSAYHAVKMLNI